MIRGDCWLQAIEQLIGHEVDGRVSGVIVYQCGPVVLIGGDKAKELLHPLVLPLSKPISLGVICRQEVPGDA